jgi:ABC-type glycerol-3-phosphate transport system permease component
MSAVAQVAPLSASPRKRGVQWSHVVVHALLIGMILGSILPLLYMVSTSIKPDGSEFEFPIRWIPDRVAWENYLRAFTQVKTLTFLKNTLVVSLVSLIGEIFTASLAAYGFARLRFPGRNALFVLMLSTLMLPYIVTLIPLFVLFRSCHSRCRRFLVATHSSFSCFVRRTWVYRANWTKQPASTVLDSSARGGRC